MEAPPPINSAPARLLGWRVRRNNRRRRNALRTAEPEVLTSHCDGTTLVETILDGISKAPIERRTDDSPTCTP